MSLYIAVITFIVMVILMDCMRAVYPLILLALMSIFISLSVNSLFDSTGSMATTAFTVDSVTGAIQYSQSDFMALLYISLTMMLFAKSAVMLWNNKRKGKEFDGG